MRATASSASTWPEPLRVAVPAKPKFNASGACVKAAIDSKSFVATLLVRLPKKLSCAAKAAPVGANFVAHICPVGSLSGQVGFCVKPLYTTGAAEAEAASPVASATAIRMMDE